MTSALAGSRAQLAMAMAAWAQQRGSLLCNSAIKRPGAHVSVTAEKGRGQLTPGADGTSKNRLRQAVLQAALAIARLMLRTTYVKVKSIYETYSHPNLNVTVL